jgi:hypothetical protein
MVAITVSHAKSVPQGAYAGTVTVGNQSGGTSTDFATNLVLPTDWNSAHQATVGLSASDMTGIFQAASGIYSTTNSTGLTFFMAKEQYYEPFALPNTNSTVSAPGIGTWYFDNFILPYPINQGQINQFVSCGAVFSNGIGITGSSSGSYSLLSTLQQRLALYDQNTTNLSQIYSVWSGSADWLATNYVTINTGTTTGSSTASISVYATVSVPTTVNNSGVASYNTFTGSGSTTLGTSTTTASTALNSLFSMSGNAGAYVSGSIQNIYGFNTTLAPGNYFLAHMFSSSTSTSGAIYGAAGTVFSTQSVLGLLENLLNGYKMIGNTVSNSTSQPQVFHGYMATTTTAPIASLGTSDFRYTTGRMYWNFNQMATT